MITEKNAVNETEAEFDFNSFDWEKWNRDMKKAIDGLIEMSENFRKNHCDTDMDSSFVPEQSETDKTKEGESNGGKVQWWKKCFTRTKCNSQA